MQSGAHTTKLKVFCRKNDDNVRMLYRFNLLSDGSPLLDEEGIELPNLETACFRAMRIAREIIAEEAKVGIIPLGWSIEIADDAGTIVATTPFANVVTIH